MESPSHELNLVRYEELRKQKKLLPVKVSAFFQKKIDEEVRHLGHRGGPLHRMVYPSPEKIEEHQSHEVKDFVDDRANMPSDSKSAFVHKYNKSILFLPTSHCLSNCLYCFRQDVLEEKKGQNTSQLGRLEDQVQALIQYAQTQPKLEELILSGGDPMLLPPKQLDYIFSEVLTHTHIREFRLHTKAIVFNPNCITPSHQEVLKKYDVRTVFHIVHPYEICSEVSKKIEELRSRKIRLYNHFPILRNINDHVDVLIENIKAVDALGIHNLSIYFPDPVQHSSTYRIRFSRLFEMVKSFQQNTPSWINATRFCQDTVHGKVRPEDLVEYREEENIAIFQRGKQRITVPDHPIELDLAGDPNIMLWKKPLANPS